MLLKLTLIAFGYLCLVALNNAALITLIPAYGRVDSGCSQNFTNVKDGNFTSHPRFREGAAYTPRKCGWLIESPEPVADLVLTFHYFDLAPNKRCDKYDNVQIYKQEEGLGWERISPNDGYCGRLSSFVVPAKGKRVYVAFNSDQITLQNGKGFNVSFVIKVSQAMPRIHCVSKINAVNNLDKCNRTVAAVEKEVITIQCYKNGLPNPSVEWLKQTNDTNGTKIYVPIRKDLIKTVISNGSIQFHNIEMSDQGTYLCNASNKLGSVNSTFNLVVSERCLCPKKIRVFWYEHPPYTRYKYEGSCKKGIYDTVKKVCFKGILFTVLTDMIKSVCGTCKKGHGESVIVWDKVAFKYQKLSDVKREITDGKKYDIYLPIEGGKDDIRYRSSYYFLPMIDSPGVAFMVIGDEAGSSSQAIFSSILDGWPILVLTVVMAFLSGIIIWMLDTYWNEEQFPRSLHEGIAEGFWWAFVTMTTVGYGDIAPLGVPGRLFAIMWILTGLVIIAIFTSVITTSLTVVTMSSSKKLYGSVVGAIGDSSEYRMGAIKNAEMKNYSTFTELLKVMDKRQVIGSLIDSYVAAHYPDFSKFRVNNIFVSNKAYGIVLGESMSKKEIYDNLTKWVDSHKAEITTRIEESTNTLKEPDGSAAMEKSSDLFNPNSDIFKNSIFGTTVILIILSVGGLMFEYGYLRPRHRMIEAAKNLEMVESREVKELAYRARCLKEILLGQVAEFHERWNEQLAKLTAKHKIEQKKLLGRGNMPPPSSPSWQNPPQQQPTVPPSDNVPMDSPPMYTANPQPTTVEVTTEDL